MDYFREIEHCIRFILDFIIILTCTILALVIPEASRQFISIILGWCTGGILGNLINIIICMNKSKKEN